MSASLLKKSLELVESDYNSNFSADKKSSRIKFASSKKKKKETRGIADIQRRNITSIEQAKSQLSKKKKKSLSNLKKLEKLRKPVVDEELAKSILDFTRKPGDKDQDVIFLKEEPKSVFTEEDFARFEAEYVDEQ